MASRQPLRDHLGLVQPEDGGEAPAIVGGGHVLGHSLEHAQVGAPRDIGGVFGRRLAAPLPHQTFGGRLQCLRQHRFEALELGRLDHQVGGQRGRLLSLEEDRLRVGQTHTRVGHRSLDLRMRRRQEQECLSTLE